MFRTMLKSKIHRATVTDCNVDYEGSIHICKKLMDAAYIQPFEQVHIYNVTNGNRFITYAMEGEEGEICINGAAAHKAYIGDIIIIVTYALIEDFFKPKIHICHVDENNKIEE